MNIKYVGQGNSEDLVLETRKLIPANQQEVFDAWTTSTEIKKWWGPIGVQCVYAEVDLRIGGQYRIDNELPDKSIVSIQGQFLTIENPRRLVYSWQTDSAALVVEQVEVCFIAAGLNRTEVVVRHSRIESDERRDQHLSGWKGCLEGLVKRFR